MQSKYSTAPADWAAFLLSSHRSFIFLALCQIKLITYFQQQLASYSTTLQHTDTDLTSKGFTPNLFSCYIRRSARWKGCYSEKKESSAPIVGDRYVHRWASFLSVDGVENIKGKVGVVFALFWTGTHAIKFRHLNWYVPSVLSV